MHIMEKKGLPPLFDISCVAVGMVLFALYVHSSLPYWYISTFGLIITAFGVFCGLRTEASPAAVLGFESISARIVLYLVLGSALGLSMGLLYLRAYKQTFLPGDIGKFALVAALIGATEEIFYRGYVQGRLRKLGPLPAVFLSAFFHTTYKIALFIFPSNLMQMNFVTFAICTFVGGSLFGILRQHTGSTWPPLLAHASFDIVAYGEYMRAPWWVWS